MTTNAELVLGGVFPDRDDRMRYLARAIRPEHFPPELRPLFELLVRYFVTTGGVMGPREFREELVRVRTDPAIQESWERVYASLYRLPVTEDARWKWAVRSMREDRQRELMVTAMTDSMRVLTDGIVERGETISGYAAARAMLTRRVHEIDQLQDTAEREGNVLEEADAVLRDYRQRKTQGIHYGVRTGLETLDRITYGAQPGEFWLVAGYAGEGKSQTLTNIAYNAMLEGKNVLFFTLETLREQVRRRLYTRHSHHAKFDRLEALRYNDIKGGRLDPEEEALFEQVVRDLADWRTQGYGRFEVVWLPRRSPPSEVSAKAEIFASMFTVDLIVVDYAGLMDADRRTERRQEALVDLLQGLKGIATSHGGHGVPLVSAYQTSRAARDEARRSGGYTLDALAETAEAERSADLVMTVLRQNDEDLELRAQILKYRDGETMREFYLDIDFARSYVGERAGGRADAGHGLV